MVDICPAVLATDQQSYNEQVTRVVTFATRLHIDISDGVFTKSATVRPGSVWWPGGVRADIHVMYKQPEEIIDALIALGPQLVIVHAEAEGDFVSLSKKLRYHGIEAGVALLADTPVELIKSSIDYIDHVLIFSGSLGRYGGQANTKLLYKAKELRSISKRVEIGWDGGVDESNAGILAAGGIEVLVSGGYIQKSNHPKTAYESLVRAANT